MNIYNSEEKLWIDKELDGLTEKLWSIFQEIADTWPVKDANLDCMKSRFRVFISNKIISDRIYFFEYVNAVRQINSRKQENIDPYELLLFGGSPVPREWQRIRDYVLKEFIKAYLAWGGFKAFGEELINHPGFIAGTNLSHHCPYIKHERI